MKYKAALFDLDDTLVSSLHPKWQQHIEIARRHWAIDLTDDDVRACWGMPLDAMIEQMYRGVDTTENILEVILSTDHEFPKNAFEGAADAISLLLDAGMNVGVVTSAPTSPAVLDLKRLGFDVDRFTFVHGQDAVASHKPDPAVFDQAFELLGQQGITKADAVYVGDLLVDYQAATSAGLAFIGVTTGLIDENDFRVAGATHLAPGIVEAVDQILRSTENS